ncbi:MAG TPA: EAL domain-containing response regulator, partial [Burkholderiaceae bacterium]|nr:EAL domain-containing response regulator [Burkholderiaceae bacterium]
MTDPHEAHVMVLDDEPFMRQWLVRLLAQAGFKNVTACEDGASALQQVDDPSRRPALILCDLNMPGMDGVEFIRKLVEHGYTGSLILVSGEDERVLQSASKLVQAHHIDVLGSLHKPVSQQGLSTLVAHWRPTPPTAKPPPNNRYTVRRLRQAIEHGELITHYQPKVRLATGEIEGMETLVRWRHPQDGLVWPDQFIGMAEAHGLIRALTHTVLVQALSDMTQWQQRGLTLKVAINVSMDNLHELDFPDIVTGHVQAAGVPPHAIVLEVTESRLAHDLRAPLEILMRLRLRRFGLSIDDFGTGHSSLAQLRDMPFDELKIDQGFVRGAHSHETNRAIVFASLRLAHELGMTSVAEGVEDQADWDFLKESGCDLAQGYFIAKPMPAD